MYIIFNVWNLTDGPWSGSGVHGLHYEEAWVNMSTVDPYFVYDYYNKFNTEGIWHLTWSISWYNCSDYSDLGVNQRPIFHRQTSSVVFTTKKSAQEIDLVAATNKKYCSQDSEMAFNYKYGAYYNSGMAFNITRTYVETQADYGTCANVANSTTRTTPCQIEIDSAAASSISASLTASLCAHPSPEISCPIKESAAQRVLVEYAACLMAAFGALGYIIHVKLSWIPE
jgi:hypothetical protein